MSRNPFIKAKLQKIRDNAAQRRHDRRMNVISQKPQVPAESIYRKTYHPDDVDHFKAEYQKQVAMERKKTIAVWIITIIATPIICYLLILFFFSDWFLS